MLCIPLQSYRIFLKPGLFLHGKIILNSLIINHKKSPAETIASAGPKVILALVGIGLYSNPKAFVAPLKMSPL